MKKTLFLLSFFFTTIISLVHSQSDNDVMQSLKTSLNPPSSLNWTSGDFCTWTGIKCSKGNQRVISIQLGNQKLTGTLPPSLKNLTQLQTLELQDNQLTGSLPSLSGLAALQTLKLNNNNFTSNIPSDFFDRMSSLQFVYLDYNPFYAWSIPNGIISAPTLQVFSAMSANVIGNIPEFFNGSTFASLSTLKLAFNQLSGGLPASLVGSDIQVLWLNGQQGNSKLSGTIDVLQNMTQLTQVWLHGNSFTGPLPDFSGLSQLVDLSLRDNQFTGPIPASLIGLPSLKTVNISNNNFQGPMPKFGSSVAVDDSGLNSFCLNVPGDCDSRVDVLLSVAQGFGYPLILASGWKGNDPCTGWRGVSCSNDGNVSVFNLKGAGLNGTISPSFSSFPLLTRLILANNNLTGTIPNELTSLSNLKELDVSNNQLYGKIPSFRSNVVLNYAGNVNIGKDGPSPTPGGGTPDSPGSKGNSGNGGKKSSMGVVVGAVVGGVCLLFLVGLLVFYFNKRKQKHAYGLANPSTVVVHPRHSGSDNDGVKITVEGSGVNGGANSETFSLGGSGPSDLRVEAGNMVISIQVLRNVTNNFSKDNILGKGGFGTVYKGELHDGTKIAVKRMESGVMSEKGLDEFKSEIAVLTKVRHRHLVALLGYCLDGNERLLVYEYMPQGTLSQHLFNWKEEGLKPLEWTKRVTLALDVARGVEYLHGLAQQSFIHRDLKPSNILLGDDMRAKVADFGLVRLAPDGKASLVTRLAGTFGYLAPEYAVTGRVTTKIDVYSFGVILMELITGRRALDETLPEESMHLVPWFRRMHINKETFHKSIDPILNLDEESLASITTVAELAGHCTAREPHQRPDMSHVVNVLSSLAELWKPSEVDPDDIYGIDLDMSLPQAVKKWQALEGMSGFDTSMIGSNDNSHTSIPTRPSGFAETFHSDDGR